MTTSHNRPFLVGYGEINKMESKIQHDNLKLRLMPRLGPGPGLVQSSASRSILRSANLNLLELDGLTSPGTQILRLGNLFSFATDTSLVHATSVIHPSKLPGALRTILNDQMAFLLGDDIDISYLTIMNTYFNRRFNGGAEETDAPIEWWLNDTKRFGVAVRYVLAWFCKKSDIADLAIEMERKVFFGGRKEDLEPGSLNQKFRSRVPDFVFLGGAPVKTEGNKTAPKHARIEASVPEGNHRHRVKRVNKRPYNDLGRISKKSRAERANERDRKEWGDRYNDFVDRAP